MKTLLEALDEKRKAEGLSQAELGAKLGVSRSMIEQMFQGRRRPGSKVLRSIVKRYPDLAFSVTDYLAHSSNGNGSND